MSKHPRLRTALRWGLISPAFFAGGAIPAMLFFLVLPRAWTMSEIGFPTPGFFFFSSALVTFGGTLAPAMIAPRAKLLIAIAFGLLHAIGGSLSSVHAIHASSQLPSYAKFAPFSYGLGALLAMALVYIIRRRKTYIEPQENTVEPPRPDEPSSAGAPEGR